VTRKLVADLIDNAGALLGEGPTWVCARQTLVWVDILAGVVHFADGSGRRIREYAVGQVVGAALPIDGGGLLLAVRDGFLTMGADGGIEPLLPFLHDGQQMRMNDAKCDPRGRAFAGSMHEGEIGLLGALYRLDDGPTATVVIDSVTVSNGLDWSPDATCMYYVDSPTRRVDTFRYDVEDGHLDKRRTLTTFNGADGVPDGLCTDETGAIWVGLHGGGAVARITPNGNLDTIIRVPCSLVTSCAFGGSDGGTLFITSATLGLDDVQRAAEPHAGALFAVRPGVTGPPATPWVPVASRAVF